MALITSETFITCNLSGLKAEMMHYFANRLHKIDWNDGLISFHEEEFNKKNPFFKSPYSLLFSCSLNGCRLMISCEFYEKEGIPHCTATTYGNYISELCQSKISKIMR